MQAQNVTTTTRPAAPPAGGIGYIRGLDGLRALAVIAVLLYHADLPVYGGFLGVESFFVISGYLITALLLADWDAHGRVRLGHFWWRRARRLLPALFALLFGVGLLTAIVLPGELGRLGGESLAALGYVMNWFLIAGGQPYFDAVERPSLLRHLWSLAVEEQFYLIWPLLFAGGMRLLGGKRLGWAALLGGVASFGLMAALADGNPSRVYFGTDTRAGGLLLGVALAFVWAPGRAPAFAGTKARLALDGVGVLALGGLLWTYLYLDEGHPLLYRGGIALAAVLTLMLVAAVTHPAAGLLPRLLELPLFRWIGVRSYSLYLWHWPVFMLTRPGIDVPTDGPLLQLARFGAAFALAEASFRWIEQPVRNGALERAWARLSQGQPQVTAADTLPVGGRGRLLGLAAPVMGMLALCVGVSYLGFSAATSAVRQAHGAPAQAAALDLDSGSSSFGMPQSAGRGSSLAFPAVPGTEEEREAQAAVAQPKPTPLPLVASDPAAAATDAASVPADTAAADTAADTAAAEAAPAAAAPAAPGTTAAAAGQPGFDPALAARLQQIVDATAADGYVPGVVVSVRLADGTTWTSSTGVADRRDGSAMLPETRVRIGSLSKLFTTVATMQLVEQGTLQLDSPVETWLPGLLPDGKRITVRHLLQHTSGLYDYLEDRRYVSAAYADPNRQWRPEQLVAMANRFPIRSAPGSRWDYSNTNFVVLAMLIEKVTGQSYADALQQQIFTRLGLNATYVAPTQEIQGPQARGYSRSETHARHSLSFAYGTANIVSTAEDMQRFGTALFHGELLKPETVQSMQQFVSGRGQYDMPSLEYGIGIMGNVLAVAPGPDGQPRPVAASRVIGHIGGINGFRSALWYVPDSDVVISLSMNQGIADPNRLATRILNALLEAQGR